MTPSRNDNRNDTATACPACGEPFTPAGRRQWCSDACGQAAWRRRHHATAPAASPGPASRDATIYQCPDCDQRYLGLFSRQADRAGRLGGGDPWLAGASGVCGGWPDVRYSCIARGAQVSRRGRRLTAAGL